jgi:zinc/manganese transport system permease protein
VSSVLHAIVEPGFFGSAQVHAALAITGAAALLCGVIGVFTVVRGQSFAGHALSDINATGGSAAFLAGISPVWGYVAISVAAAGAMEAIGIDRRRGRDIATGIVLVVGFGLAALFLFWDTTLSGASNATNEVLFGSIWTLSPGTVPIVIALGAGAITLLAVIYRPLLLSSVSSELAAARGVSVRIVGALYLLALAAAVALTCVAIGAILSTGLLIGPAAGALHLSRRPWSAMASATAIALAASWLGILLAYDSYYWPPVGNGWPVSFFIVVLVFLFYAGARIRAARG